MDVLKNLPPSTWAMIGAAAALGWSFALGTRWFRQHRARKLLLGKVTAVAFDHVGDVLVPDGMGGAYHVDFLLLTPRGLLVLDLRDVQGNIFGGDQMREWTVMDGPRRSTFVNPQSGLYDRVAAVKALAGDAPVEGRIVFTARAKFPKGLPSWTLTVDSLRSEFPPVDRAALGGVVAQYEEAWSALKAALTPSRLSSVRPAAAP